MDKSVFDLSLRGKRALLNMMSVFYKLGVITPQIFFKLFDAQIQPILLYGSEVWGYRKYESIENEGQ